MGYRKTGVIIFVVLVVLALVVYGLSRVSITKSPAPKGVSSEEKSSGDTSVSTSKETDTSNKSSEENGWQEITPSSINYSSEELRDKGSVVSKKVFLTDDNQLVYQLQIKVDGKDLVLSYYCGYNAFSSLVKGDSVTVVYKIVSKGGVYAVLCIEKE